jgi:hypothetical protein
MDGFWYPSSVAVFSLVPQSHQEQRRELQLLCLSVHTRGEVVLAIQEDLPSFKSRRVSRSCRKCRIKKDLVAYPRLSLVFGFAEKVIAEPKVTVQIGVRNG